MLMELISNTLSVYNDAVGKLPTGIQWGDIKSAFQGVLFSFGFEI